MDVAYRVGRRGHDRAAASGDHMRQGRVYCGHRSDQDVVGNVVPVGVGQPDRRDVPVLARQHCDSRQTSEHAHGLVNDALGLALHRDVAGDGHDPGPVLLGQVGCRCLTTRRVPADDGHLGALLGEHRRGRESHALRSAHDQIGPRCHPEIHGPPSARSALGRAPDHGNHVTSPRGALIQHPAPAGTTISSVAPARTL